MDNRFLMCVLHALTHLDEQFLALPDGQTVAVAISVDRQTRHVFHDEIRLAIGRRSGVEHLRNRWMIHQGKRLLFRAKTLQTMGVVSAQPDQLHRDLALDWIRLFSELYLPHAAFAKPPNKRVGTDRSGLVAGVSIKRRNVIRGGAG